MFKFTLRNLFFLTLVSALLALWSLARMQGSDSFLNRLQTIGGRNAEKFGSGKVLEPNSASIFDQILGQSQTIRSEIQLRDLSLTCQDCLAIRRLKKTEPIQSLVLERVEVEVDAVCFYQSWSNIREVELRDIKNLPASWLATLADLNQLRLLTISGANTSVDWKTFGTLSQLERLIISNQNMHGQPLAELRRQLPTTDIYVTGLWNEPWHYHPSETLSVPNDRAKSVTAKLMNDLEAELDLLAIPISDQLNPPASLEEIAELEHLLGQPLTADIRAFLELHNGEPSDAGLTSHRLFTVAEIKQQYREWNEISIFYDTGDRDFYAKYWNPRLLPIGAYNEVTLAVDLENGHLIQGDSESIHRDLDGTFFALLEKIIQQIHNGQFDRKSNGTIEANEDANRLFQGDRVGTDFKLKRYDLLMEK